MNTIYPRILTTFKNDPIGYGIPRLCDAHIQADLTFFCIAGSVETYYTKYHQIMQANMDAAMNLIRSNAQRLL